LDKWGGGSSSSSSRSTGSSSSSRSGSSSSSSSENDSDEEKNSLSNTSQSQPSQQQQQRLKPNNPFAAAAGFKNIFATAAPPAPSTPAKAAAPVVDPLKVVPGDQNILKHFETRLIRRL
jgi:hypothetical protein